MRARCLLLVCILAGGFPRAMNAQHYADRGAVLGGVAGALAGAGIGDHNDETAAGALIGGAVGVLSGAAVGHTMDHRAAKAHAARQYAQQARQRQLSRSVSTQDVLTMTRNGVPEEVIINHIRRHGVQRTLGVQDVISLHRQGVPESVITAMQEAPVGPTEPVPTTVVREPVFVESYQYVAPAPRVHYYHGPAPHYSWRRYAPRPR